MREFNLDLLIGKDVVVNCKTKDEQQEFLKFLDSKGIKWNSGFSIFKSGIYDYSEYKENTCFLLKNGMLLYSPISWYQEEGYKIISLDDLVIKPKNNFNDYGFEADFEGEILKEIEDMSAGKVFIGYIVYDCKVHSCIWQYNGVVITIGINQLTFNLKPIKKEWYNNPDNIGKLLKAENKETGLNELCTFKHKGKDSITAIGLDGKEFIGFFSHFRPATKEEISSLMMKI